MKSIFATIVASSLFIAFTTHANAAASDLDDCILDITFQCVEADDFWDCYETGVELCENQSSREIQEIPEAEKRAVEASARDRAERMLQESMTKKQ